MIVTPVTLWTPEHDDDLAWVVAFTEKCRAALPVERRDEVVTATEPEWTGEQLAAYFCDREPMTRQAA
jgi:hypothetical protein